MAERLLAGTRIRERRTAMGLRQAQLAEMVGISAAYLNLIEHNRRRIGGKLLNDIARELDTEPGHLSAGARAGVVEALQQVARGRAKKIADPEAFAERFPGWAGVVTDQQAQIESQNELIRALSDRLTHDPQLAASLHEILSVTTALRSTAGILADGGALDAGWLNRFHRNIYEDSQRLAESTRALVAYLEQAEERDALSYPLLPLDVLDRWLAARNYRIEELEPPGGAGPEEVLAAHPELDGVEGLQALARGYLAEYASDVRALDAERLARAIAGQAEFDPLSLAGELGVSFATVLRRIAALPHGAGPECGLARCDSSGTLTFHKGIEGFPLPRYGAACPIWPLFAALARPEEPMRHTVEQSGHGARRFVTYSVGVPVAALGFGMPRVVEATMLIVPAGADGAGPVLKVGAGCRICSQGNCPARREPSILLEARA